MKLLRSFLFLELALVVSAHPANRWWNWWWPSGISEDLNDVDLILHTFGNPSWTFKFGADSQDLLNNGFDPNKPTKLLSHGYTDNGPRFCEDFISAFENDPMETFNIICIDWQILAKADAPVFDGAANNAVRVGKAVGEQVVGKMMIQDLGQDPNKIHAIGHSMGAQLVGNIGNAAFQSTSQKIARVTGLDTAQAYFEQEFSATDLISKDSAKLVDIMHTNSGPVYQGYASNPNPIGMIDFYPNGGAIMPGCSWPWTNFCAHMKTLDYYVDSVINRNNVNYLAGTKCDSYDDYEAGNCDGNQKLPMGEALTLDMLESTDEPQKFFLNTNAVYPFGQ